MNKVKDFSPLTFQEIMQKYRTPREKKLSWFRHIYRFLGVWITKILLPTRVTPNQISFFAFFIGFPGVFLLLCQSYLLKLLAIFLIQFSFTLDFADGTLARIKKLTSANGDYLDSTVNAIIGSLFLFFTGLANFHRIGLSGVVLGFSASFGFILIKFFYAMKLRSVVNIERNKVYEALSNSGTNSENDSVTDQSIRPDRQWIIRLEYVIWNYIYILNYLTLAFVFKLDYLAIIFYAISLPLYAFYVFYRLYKADLQETLDWIKNPDRCV